MPNFVTTATGSALAYEYQPGATPGIVFFCGFRSDMYSSKANALATFCQQQQRAYLRFDYRAHGQSPGDFNTCTLGDWLEDALTVFDQVTTGTQILVGSSMGGWLATLLALQRPDRIHALVGIAPALDFTEDLVWNKLSIAEQEQLQRQGCLHRPATSAEETPYDITWRFIAEGRQRLLLRAPIALTCPVRILQGLQDDVVPWQHNVRFLQQLTTPDVRLTLVKDGDHRLTRPQDLHLLAQTLTALLPTDNLLLQVAKLPQQARQAQ